LENLPLRKDALRALDLPIEVKAGFIGKLQLQIPLRRVKSEAWVIRISQLYLVAGPPVSATYNEEHEKQAYQMRKQAELKSLEEKWKAGRQVKSSGFWSTLTSSFASSIGENLQVIKLS
jgi:vacuolar protein sorting-associated protein 13D